MKRIVMSLGTLVFAAAIVVGGTGAFFSDTETSTGNVFTAGSVTLLLNNITHAGNNDDEVVGFTTTEDETGISFAFDDLKPLDTGTVSFQVLNGANPAYVCARVIDQGGADNTLVGPEEDLSDTLAEGELDQFLSFAFDGGVGTIADVDGQWTELVTSPLAANTPTNSSFDYCFGEFDGSSCVLGAGDYNLAQTDSLSADVEFYAVQTRNNDGFSCDSLNEPEPPLPPVVTEGGVNFEDYAGARFRSFGNTGGDEVYVGANDLGVGANRVAAGYTWGSTQPVTVSYDSTLGEVTATVDGTVVDITRVDGLSCTADAMQINVAARDAGTSVALNSLTLGGFPLTSLSATFNEFNTWNITGFDFGSDFTLTADLDLTGSFGTSQELSRIDINYGCLI